jgi:hypothetical protein
VLLSEALTTYGELEMETAASAAQAGRA